MELSGYYKDLFEIFDGIDDLINSWASDCKDDPFKLTYYATSDLLDTRELIYILELEEDQRVKEADRALFEYILENGADTAMWKPDEASLDKWWWYLDKIAEKSYPAELLPEYLREIYLKARREADYKGGI